MCSSLSAPSQTQLRLEKSVNLSLKTRLNPLAASADNLLGRKRPVVRMKKNCIRIVVLAGILAWPAVEGYRLHVAKKQLAQSEKLHKNVQMAAEAAKLKYAQAPSNKL